MAIFHIATRILVTLQYIFFCICNQLVVPLRNKFINEDMELKCPQCGKWMAVSQEELVIHDSQVVCPQCLAVCRLEGDELVARDDSQTLTRRSVNVTEVNHASTKFCHSCGKQLPSGIQFCPYCGVDLKAPFSSRQPQVQTNPEPKPQPKPVKEPKPKPVERPSEPERQVPTSNVEEKLRTIKHYNSTSIHGQLHQRGSKASPLFKVVAYTIIVALIAILVAIIYAGNQIETQF